MYFPLSLFVKGIWDQDPVLYILSFHLWLGGISLSVAGLKHLGTPWNIASCWIRDDEMSPLSVVILRHALAPLQGQLQGVSDLCGLQLGLCSQGMYLVLGGPLSCWHLFITHIRCRMLFTRHGEHGRHMSKLTLEQKTSVTTSSHNEIQCCSHQWPWCHSPFQSDHMCKMETRMQSEVR